MGFLLIWAILGVAAAFIAQGKGKSFVSWFILGIIFGPIAIIVIALSSSNQCPFCKKGVDPQATVCPYCQRELPKQSGQINASMTTDEKIDFIMKQPSDRHKKLRQLADLRDGNEITSDRFNELRNSL